MRNLLASLLLLLSAPCFASLTVPQNASVAEANPSVAFGSSVAAGSVIIATTQNDSNPCTSETLSDTVNSGSYTLLSSWEGNGPCIYWKVANATGTPTVSVSGTSGTISLSVAQVTGWVGTPTADSSVTQTWTATSATLTVSPLVSAQNNEVFFADASYYGGAYGTGTSSGWTVFSSAPNAPYWNSGNPGYAIAATAGTSIPLSATISASETWYLTLAGIWDNSGPAPGVNNAIMPLRLLGFGFGYSSGGGGGLALNGSPSSPTIGSLYSASLTPSGGSGSGYACSQVSATPNTALWLSITPACQLQGIPQYAETESVTEQVTDSAGNTATKTLSLTPATSGSLTVLTSTTLPVNATSGGYYAYPITIQGGYPPYDCSWPQTQPWQVTPDCWIEGTPTSTGTQTFSDITVTDTEGNTATYSPTLTIDSTLRFGSVDYAIDQINCPQAQKNSYWQCQLVGYGGSGTLSYSVTSGLPAWASVSSSTGLISGTPASSGNVSMTGKVADTASHTFSATILVNVSSGSQVSRPSYNSSTGNGFFVLSGKLYDPNGYPFSCAGVDRDHYDSTSWASGAAGAQSGANCAREFFGFGEFTQTGSAMATQITQEYVDNGIVPIVTCPNVQTTFTGSISGTTLTITAISTPTAPGNAGIIVTGPNSSNGGMAISGTGISGTYYIESQLTGTSGSTGTYQLYSSPGTIGSESITEAGFTSGNSDPNAIVGCTNEIASVESSLGSVQSNIIINIANEWGLNGQESTWETYYAAAISTLRADGYTAPFLIDIPSDAEDSAVFSGGQAAALLASDSLQNVEFDTHLYNTTAMQSNIMNISKGADAVITFAYAGATNPWTQLTNFFGGVIVSGVAGMTQINGQQVPVTSFGSCSAGSCTINTSLNTSSYSSYTSGGIVYDQSQYAQRVQLLASYPSLAMMVGELGPPGEPATSCSAGTLNNQSVATSLLISSLRAYGIPYASWAWDDNNEDGGETSWDCWFGDTLAGPGTFARNTPSGLTKTGMDVVDQPRAGLITAGTPTTVLH